MPSFIGHVVPGSMIGVLSFWYLWVMLHRYFKSLLDKIHQPRYDQHDHQQQEQQQFRLLSTNNGKMPASEDEGNVTGVACNNNNNKGGNRFIAVSKHHQQQEQLHYEFESSVLVTCCGTGRVPMMCCITLPLISVGIMMEIYAVFREGLPDLFNNGQHMTIYFFYGLIGFFELLVIRGVPIPHGSDYALFMLALVVEGFIFANHLEGRSPVDVTIHTCVVYLLVASCIALAIEMKYRRNPLAAIVRNILGIAHGTWFHVAAWILYPPSLYPITKDIHPGEELPSMANIDHEAMHRQTKLLTLYLAMNIAGTIALTLLLGWLVNKRVSRLGQKAPTYDYNLDTAAAFGTHQTLVAQHVAYAPLLESEAMEDFANNHADVEMSFQIGRI